MRRVMSVGFILLLTLGAFTVPLHGQDAGGGTPPGVRERGFSLEQNYPNPFNPSTTIPFVLGEQLFEDGKPVVVTIRILNLLRQLVAIPTALNHPDGSGVPVQDLVYTTPGPKQAYWDGLDRAGNKVASGIYIVQLIVNGQSTMRRVVVTK